MLSREGPWLNFSKIRLRSSAGMPGPSSVTAGDEHLFEIPARSSFHLDSPRRGHVKGRIEQQMGDRLLHQDGVGLENGEIGWNADRRGRPLSWQPHGPAGGGHEIMAVAPVGLGLEHSRLQAGLVEQICDEAVQAMDGDPNLPNQVLASGGIVRAELVNPGSELRQSASSVHARRCRAAFGACARTLQAVLPLVGGAKPRKLVAYHQCHDKIAAQEQGVVEMKDRER